MLLSLAPAVAAAAVLLVAQRRSVVQELRAIFPVGVFNPILAQPVHARAKRKDSFERQASIVRPYRPELSGTIVGQGVSGDGFATATALTDVTICTFHLAPGFENRDKRGPRPCWEANVPGPAV